MEKNRVIQYICCLCVIGILSCGRDDITSTEYYRDVPDVSRLSTVGITGIELTPVKVDSMETSYIGFFWHKNDSLYFSDSYYNYIFHIGTDGKILGRYVGRGRGPGEVIHFSYSVPFEDGYCLYSISNSFIYWFNGKWEQTKSGRLDWGNMAEYKAKALFNPNPAQALYYESDGPLPDIIQQWDSDYLAMSITAALPKFNGYENTKLYYDYSRILTLINKNTGRAERVFGRRPPIFLSESNIPNMDRMGYVLAKDTVFVTFRPDSTIYMLDKINDRVIGKFGRHGRNMNTNYIKTLTFDEGDARWYKDRKTFGYYTYMRYDEKRQLLFRGYHQGSHSQYDGLQIYKNHALLCDIDVPKGFTIVGYCDDQLIASIDEEGDVDDLIFYTVNLNYTENHQEIEIVENKGLFVCKEPSVNLGTVPENDSIVCQFLFINQGLGPVRVIDYSVSCDCMGLLYDDKDILANDSLIITLSINTSGKKPGKNVSAALIKTNGKRQFYDIKANFDIGVIE